MTRKEIEAAQQYLSGQLGQALGLATLAKTLLEFPRSIFEYDGEMTGTVLGRPWSLRIKAKI